jgi:ubiquinone/menaquinone biosynthesis C-methylase UbiE
MTNISEKPPIIDYEGSDYQTSFWDEGGREYEDQSERIAIKRLLPDQGNRLLELGAGAGRNTSRYSGFKQIVLLDYSLTQLKQAQEHLGRCDRFIYVAADVYHLPFVNDLFDGATMIRTLHHMQNPLTALSQVQQVLIPQSPFILEYANKQNLKAILRYALRKQDWSPFTLEAVEFAELNFDFHPKKIREWLSAAGFILERQLTVSHFRINLLKKLIPTRLLVFLDSILQYTGRWWQFTPSVFTRSLTNKPAPSEKPKGFFKCPSCGNPISEVNAKITLLSCQECENQYPIIDGIYDFREQ